MKKVIAYIGKKRVGKDLAADYTAKKLGCTKYALATPLKEMVCSMLNITMEELDKYKNENWNLLSYKSLLLDMKDRNIIKDRITYSSHDPHKVVCDDVDISFRSILQKCGDEMKAFFGIDCYLQKLHSKLLMEDTMVVSDVRLKEEVKWLIAHTNPIFIKIERDVILDHNSAHRTEKEVDELGYDVLVENNGTIEELYAKLDKIIK